MKHTKFKCALPLLMAFMLLISASFAGWVKADLLPKAEAKTYSVGDVITLGSYPQERITDDAAIAALDAIKKDWVSFGYYSVADDGKGQPGDWMRYADIIYNEAKYRAVTFDCFRSVNGYTTDKDDLTNQDDNGYLPNVVYYFRFEPLRWRVLDPAAGLVLSENIIDSQAFQNSIYHDKSESGWNSYFTDESCSDYANAYAASSLRNWLNTDFYHTAFSPSEQAAIAITKLDNNQNSESDESPSSSDKIFLLSFNDTRNAAYGFNGNDSLPAKGTDYAKCQGLQVFNYDGIATLYFGNSIWWLRTPSSSSGHDNADSILFNGYYGGGLVVQMEGIRPAFHFKSGIADSSDFNGGDDVPSVDVFPGDVDGDNEITSGDARLALRASVRLEQYEPGSASFLAADVDGNGTIESSDARTILRVSVKLDSF